MAAHETAFSLMNPVLLGISALKKDARSAEEEAQILLGADLGRRSNKKLLVTSATLVVTGALLVVTRSY